jgi:hypothetical protein
MLGGFCLCHVVMRFAPTPQRLPVQFMGGVRARSRMLHPPGLGPSIHAGRSHVEPSGGFRLASAIPHTINDALAQIP